jgi:hypothetical protein
VAPEGAHDLATGGSKSPDDGDGDKEFDGQRDNALRGGSRC